MTPEALRLAEDNCNAAPSLLTVCMQPASEEMVIDLESSDDGSAAQADTDDDGELGGGAVQPKKRRISSNGAG